MFVNGIKKKKKAFQNEVPIKTTIPSVDTLANSGRVVFKYLEEC